MADQTFSLFRIIGGKSLDAGEMKAGHQRRTYDDE
jgi:hypothetical protein